jgi:Protein of unknown function (DUF3352)
VGRLVSVLATSACAGALALAGCGGGDSDSSALDSALGYLPKDAPFAVAIDSNLSGGQYSSLNKLVEKFPFSDEVKRQITQSIEGNGTSFKKDIRPLLGNPVVVGGVSARAITDNAGGNDDFVLAFQVKDKDKLGSLIEKEKAKEQGERSGAKLYKTRQGDWLAVEDDVLVAAGSKSLLEGALDRRDEDDHFTQADFDKGLAGLPKEALVRVYADVEALIKSDPSTADAQRIEWIKALRTLGLSAVAKDDSLRVDYKLETEGDLTADDLPIASGDDAPGVLRERGEIGLGLRDLAQIVKFAEAAGQAVDPTGYGDYAAAKRQIEQRFGVDLDRDLIGQLEGDTAMSFGLDGKFSVRAELEDPAAFKRTLAKVADLLPQFAKGAGAGDMTIVKPKRGGDFYALADPNDASIVFGVVGDVFVVANDPSRARRLATEKPSAVSRAKGSVAMGADAEQLARTVVASLAPLLGGGLGAGLFTAPLKELNGSLSATPDGLRGSFELSLDD